MDIANVIKMHIFGFLLLIISLTKLLLAVSSNKMEMKELAYHNPVWAHMPPGLIASIIIADGLIGLVCSLILLGALW